MSFSRRRSSHRPYYGGPIVPAAPAAFHLPPQRAAFGPHNQGNPYVYRNLNVPLAGPAFHGMDRYDNLNLQVEQQQQQQQQQDSGSDILSHGHGQAHFHQYPSVYAAQQDWIDAVRYTAYFDLYTAVVVLALTCRFLYWLLFVGFEEWHWSVVILALVTGGSGVFFVLMFVVRKFVNARVYWGGTMPFSSLL